MSKYDAEQIKRVIESNKDNEFDLRLIIKGENDKTNNLNITEKQAYQILEILENKMYYTSGMGLVELEMTREQAESVSGSGQQFENVKALSQVPEIKEQLDMIDKDRLKRELREYGSWTDNQLEDHEENLIRILWIAGCDIVEVN